jgi:hypothetical protein
VTVAVDVPLELAGHSAARRSHQQEQQYDSQQVFHRQLIHAWVYNRIYTSKNKTKSGKLCKFATQKNYYLTEYGNWQDWNRARGGRHARHVHLWYP